METILESEEERKSIYANAVMNDRSYDVVSEALAGLASIDPELAMVEAKKLEGEKSSKMTFGILQLYAVHGSEEKINYFVEALSGTTLQGWDRLGAINATTLFVANHDASVAEKALPIYEEALETGGYYMQMFIPQNVNYLNEYFTKSIVELNEELKAYEENNDAAYADQTRKKITAFETVQKKYQDLLK